MSWSDLIVAAWWPALLGYSTIWLWRRIERLNREMAEAAARTRARRDELALRVGQLELIAAAARDLKRRPEWVYRSAPLSHL